MGRKRKSRAELPEATELEWLRWFYCNADFGPADADVYQGMRCRFEDEKLRRVPSSYCTPEDEV